MVGQGRIMFKVGDIVMHRFQSYSYGYVICIEYTNDDSLEVDEIVIQWFNGSVLWHLQSTLMRVD